jgi:hypothetical protein
MRCSDPGFTFGNLGASGVSATFDFLIMLPESPI